MIREAVSGSWSGATQATRALQNRQPERADHPPALRSYRVEEEKGGGGKFLISMSASSTKCRLPKNLHRVNRNRLRSIMRCPFRLFWSIISVTCPLRIPHWLYPAANQLGDTVTGCLDSGRLADHPGEQGTWILIRATKLLQALPSTITLFHTTSFARHGTYCLFKIPCSSFDIGISP